MERKAIELRAHAWKEFAMRQNPELNEQEAWEWALELAEREYTEGPLAHLSNCVVLPNEENGPAQERPSAGRDDKDVQ